MRHTRLLGASLLVPTIAFVLACAGDNGSGPNGNTPTFSTAVQPIFTASCALSGCHAGSTPAEGMNLSSGQAYANIVNVPSNQSALDRVEPNQPDNSYLVHKIQGTAGTVNGTSATRMPLTGCCLTTQQINTIRDWIAAGALNN